MIYLKHCGARIYQDVLKAGMTIAKISVTKLSIYIATNFSTILFVLLGLYALSLDEHICRIRHRNRAVTTQEYH